MLIIYEFPTSPDEWMVPQVVDVLEARGQAVSTFGGRLQGYRPGGFGFRRIVNLLGMLSALPFVLLVRRPDLTVIRSAPPGLHMWGALWLRLLRLWGVCCLMDYHPEIEARALERRAWGRPLAALLRGWDWFALNIYEHSHYTTRFERGCLRMRSKKSANSLASFNGANKIR